MKYELELYKINDIPDGILIKSMRIEGNLMAYKEIIMAILSKVLI